MIRILHTSDIHGRRPRYKALLNGGDRCVGGHRGFLPQPVLGLPAGEYPHRGHLPVQVVAGVETHGCAHYGGYPGQPVPP